VYSQELFVLALAMRIDPLAEAPIEALKLAVKNHPAFEYLFSQKFPWPDSNPGDLVGPITVVTHDRGVDESPLYRMGYSVGKTIGLGPTSRRQILKDTHQSDQLPRVGSSEYMDEWGDALSSQRLWRIAWHLHWMTEVHRQHEEAVAKWEADLSWLRANYYRPIHRFVWP
jgi:hypothetical protein